MNDLLTPRQLLDTFVLAQIGTQPVNHRGLLYRALAAETSDTTLKDTCTALADDCDAIERSHAQLVLDFQRRAS